MGLCVVCVTVYLFQWQIKGLYVWWCIQSSGVSRLEPDPYVVLKLGNNQHRTMVKESATNPTWEEQFEFLCGDPTLQELSVAVSHSLNTSASCSLTRSFCPVSTCVHPRNWPYLTFWVVSVSYPTLRPYLFSPVRNPDVTVGHSSLLVSIQGHC